MSKVVVIECANCLWSGKPNWKGDIRCKKMEAWIVRTPVGYTDPPCDGKYFSKKK